MKKLVLSTLFIFTLLCFNNNLFSKESFLCNISHELENKKPAKKRLYKINKLELFVDLKNDWINDISRESWLEIEKNNLSRINTNFMKNKTKYIFLYKRYYSEKKKNLELSYEIIFDKKTGSMSFPKNYFKNENELFFSTEVRGICKK